MLLLQTFSLVLKPIITSDFENSSSVVFAVKSCTLSRLIEIINKIKVYKIILKY